jgi:hypothetical protein
VRGITKWGNENNQYFDTQTGLLVGYGFHQWNASGTGRESTLTRQVFDDYRDFDGLLIPMQISTFGGGRFLGREQDTSVQFDDIDYGLAPTGIEPVYRGPGRSRRIPESPFLYGFSHF